MLRMRTRPPRNGTSSVALFDCVVRQWGAGFLHLLALTSGRTKRLATEVLEVPARCGAALALVLAADAGRTVGRVGRRGHSQEADLADLHARVQRDGQVGHVRQLESEVAVPPGVDESGRRVDQQP